VTGAALVAVGGYGRRALAPFSDLDVVLVHDPGTEVAALASAVWYPLWDAGVALDHAVRALPEATAAARADVRVALGLLDARHVAGDPSVTVRLRTDLLAHWRRDARDSLPALRETVRARGVRHGELGHVSVPDLKECSGGLRDVTVLDALRASWLVDVPHGELARCRLRLLDVRDRLQEVTGRASDRVAPEVWEELARRLDLPDAGAAQRLVRATGRRVTHLSRLTWGRVDALLARPRHGAVRRPALEPVAPGVAVSSGEVVLDRGADPARDPLLVLRAAAEAAERNLVLAPATSARLARYGAALPEPWSRPARHLLVRLLASGPGLLTVWETLEETGALDRFLPQWERVRLLPHVSPVHRFTVDRHLVETCIEASRLLRRVDRPDLLTVAALLHDVGKGSRLDHSVAGAATAEQTARRMGFSEAEVAVVRVLVRRHLLLVETAVSRDVQDPATVDHVADRVGDIATLRLLEALTEADARATAAKAWSPWRAGLVRELARRVERRLGGGRAPVPPARPAAVPVDAEARRAVLRGPDRIEVAVRAADDGARVTVAACDRVGLMAAVAGALALLRAGVRTVRGEVDGDVAVSVWDVADPHLDAAILRQRIDAVLAGRLQPGRRLRPAADHLDPVVVLHPGASEDATVLEVRAGDRTGVLFRVCDALARLGLTVRSVHVDTFGPQAVDVFYVQEPRGGRPTDARAAAAVHAVRRALARPATLDH
jgi:[protein-PII] uridylyltransferase